MVREETEESEFSYHNALTRKDTNRIAHPGPLANIIIIIIYTAELTGDT